MPSDLSRLESIVIADEKLYSKYCLIKERAIEIIKWSPPVDLDAPDIPPYYTDHGVEHSQRILSILDRLTQHLTLEIYEIFPLICSVWLHDVGMFVGREPGEAYDTTRSLHHLRSEQYITQEAKMGSLPLNQWHLPNVKSICRAHRSKVKFDQEPIIPRERPFEDGIGNVRIQLLCCLLRFADACDVHHSRAPETVFQVHKELIPSISKEHWKKSFRVGQVRFNWEKTSVEVLINLEEDQKEIKGLHKIAQVLRNELRAELSTVETIFNEYGIKLFHVEVIDYQTGGYLEFNKHSDTDTLGWAVYPFEKKAPTLGKEVLVFKPILSSDEVEQCYIDISAVTKLAQEMKRNNFKQNYLFKSHPRTGKTSMLAYFSNMAIENGVNVFWFVRYSDVPSYQEFVRKLSADLDENTILVFDNIHEDKKILSLLQELIREKPKLVLWCASRISEFVSIKESWS